MLQAAECESAGLIRSRLRIWPTATLATWITGVSALPYKHVHQTGDALVQLTP